MRVIGLDIGGANLKAAHTTGAARSVAFELWKRPADLPRELEALVSALPPADLLAVTMTAELCDCFRTKRDGVSAVLDAVAHVANNLGSLPVRVWQTDGTLVTIDEARAEPLKTAAANWLALATLVARWCPDRPGVLIDIGSTTTDIIPIRAGHPVPRGRTDTGRLRSGELLYTGVRRTPICAVVSHVPWRGAACAVAAELFATTLDAYLVLGDIPEDPAGHATADGRPATREFARERLARIICADRETFTTDDARTTADAVAAAHSRQIETALRRVLNDLVDRPATFVTSGTGEFLACRVTESVGGPDAEIISVRHRLGNEISAAACAYALAVIAADTCNIERRAPSVATRLSTLDSPLSASPEERPVVVKIGGSLLDLPNLGTKLRAWLDATCGTHVILVAGGGPSAEIIRTLDRRHSLGEETSHSLALRAMELGAHVLQSLLPGSTAADTLANCARAWKAGLTPILSPRELLAEAERSGAPTVPHDWSATSDSIAAWLAHRAGAGQLVLLKSTSLPGQAPPRLEDAVRLGIIDPHFPLAAARLPSVRLVNFRSEPPHVQTIPTIPAPVP